uniref:Uncharacterized protein n=1 Tax=Anguilla anguilla TaxID=7936 RepID=A0A0E9V6T0_ANGAN
MLCCLWSKGFPILSKNCQCGCTKIRDSIYQNLN